MGRGLKTSVSKVSASEIKDGKRLIKSEFYTNYTKAQTRTFAPPGFDSAPIEGDEALIIEVGTSGKTAMVGIVPNSESGPGESRIYSRDSDGNIKSRVHCKANGDIEIISEGKIAIDNNAEKFKTLIDDLIEEIKAIVTIGSPSIHNIKPTTQVKFDALKARFNDLFKEG